MTSHLELPLALPVADYLSAISFHGAELADRAEEAGLDAAVPTCPGWTVLDLVQHTEVVFRHKTEGVRHPTTEGPPARVELSEDSGVATYRDALEEMLDVFATADLTVPSWTWCTHDHRADWWIRRMAHEAAIHAADAVVASGQTPTVDLDLAIDGVDEILDEMLVGGPSWGTVTPGTERIDLAAGNRTWQVRFGTFSGVSPRSGKAHELDTLIHDVSGAPDAVVTTEPPVLDLWLWGRAPLGDESVVGDTSTVAKLRALAAEGTS